MSEELNFYTVRDKYRYYVQQKLRGQLILFKVDAPQKRFEIFFQGQPLQRMPIHGLHRETVSLQVYLRQICKEAVSEERRRLNQKQHWSAI